MGRPAGFDRTDQSLVAVAVSLLSLAVERGGGGDTAEQRLREAALRLLLSGSDPDDLPWDLLGWGWLRTEPLRVVRVPGAGGGASLAESLGATDGERASAMLDDQLVVVVPDRRSEVDSVVDELAGSLAGGSGPATLETFGSAWAQAGGALSPGERSGRRVARRRRSHAACSASLDPTAARAFADSLLAPLDATGGKADLLASTRAWLAHHGQWDVAAQELGVHRHTLRYRIRRVEELLGRSMDDADLRAELWVALELRAHQDG